MCLTRYDFPNFAELNYSVFTESKYVTNLNLTPFWHKQFSQKFKDLRKVANSFPFNDANNIERNKIIDNVKFHFNLFGGNILTF